MSLYCSGGSNKHMSQVQDGTQRCRCSINSVQVSLAAVSQLHAMTSFPPMHAKRKACGSIPVRQRGAVARVIAAMVALDLAPELGQHPLQVLGLLPDQGNEREHHEGLFELLGHSSASARLLAGVESNSLPLTCLGGTQAFLDAPSPL